MSVSVLLDLTIDFNADSKASIDLQGFEAGVIQFESATGAVTFGVSNDGGAITGTRGPSALNSTGYQPVQLINNATGLGATSAGAGSATYRFGVIGNYLQLLGSAVTVGRLLIYLYKPM